MKALAVTSAIRQRQLPDVPTMLESGVADYVAVSFFGVMAPARTSKAIVDKLNFTINQILGSSDVQIGLAKFGAQASPDSPHAFATFIAAETQKWAKVATTAGIKD
jgi:tripartite-type tricarboxylate transporter receptor subunit TctC